MTDTLQKITQKMRERLHDAYLRYMVLVDIYEARDVLISDECAASDKAKFPHLIKQCPRGGLVAVQEDFALFASKICACSWEVAIAWDEKEFIDEHGVTSDEMHRQNKKDFQDIENLIAQSTADQAWALYFVSEGVVRENIATAVMTHIAKGNKALKAAFPEFAHADPESHN